MKWLDWTFEAAEENLACDEAFLDLCEEGAGPEMLRFWRPQNYFVVAGYSNKIRIETHLEKCEKKGISVFRRPSGGGTVLQGPGCLNYSLILKISGNGAFKTLTQATSFIMKQHAGVLSSLIGKEVKVQGISDLALNNLKFSGNAQRRKQKAFLFHGTFLLDFNLSLMEELLAMPSRRPAYRQDRSHSGFLTNLAISSERIQEALVKTWKAAERFPQALLPVKQIRALVLEKYSRRDWNFKF